MYDASAEAEIGNSNRIQEYSLQKLVSVEDWNVCRRTRHLPADRQLLRRRMMRIKDLRACMGVFYALKACQSQANQTS